MRASQDWWACNHLAQKAVWAVDITDWWSWDGRPVVSTSPVLSGCAWNPDLRRSASYAGRPWGERPSDPEDAQLPDYLVKIQGAGPRAKGRARNWETLRLHPKRGHICSEGRWGCESQHPKGLWASPSVLGGHSPRQKGISLWKRRSTGASESWRVPTGPQASDDIGMHDLRDEASVRGGHRTAGWEPPRLPRVTRGFRPGASSRPPLKEADVAVARAGHWASSDPVIRAVSLHKSAWFLRNRWACCPKGSRRWQGPRIGKPCPLETRQLGREEGLHLPWPRHNWCGVRPGRWEEPHALGNRSCKGADLCWVQPVRRAWNSSWTRSKCWGGGEGVPLRKLENELKICAV